MPTDDKYYRVRWQEQRRLLTAVMDSCNRSCMSCINFTERTESCLKAGDARPPARVIAYGCEQWEEDIPF
jgi:hypothetical protein